MNVTTIYNRIFNPTPPKAEQVIKQELEKRLLEAQLARHSLKTGHGVKMCYNRA